MVDGTFEQQVSREKGASYLFSFPETLDKSQKQDKTDHLWAEKQLQSDHETSNVVHFHSVL